MNKQLTFFVLFLLGIFQAHSQMSFRPGFRGGVNISHFTEGGDDGYYYIDEESTDIEFSSKTDFYIGFYGALKLSRVYTMQPEFTYSRQGTKYSYKDSDMNIRERKVDVSYLSAALINKFTFGSKFNMHVGPTIDFITDKTRDLNVESDIDLAFTAGFGYNFTDNLGAEARIKKGIIPVLDSNNSYHDNVVFSVGVTYTFDVK
jgi:hypothetical protein